MGNGACHCLINLLRRYGVGYLSPIAIDNFLVIELFICISPFGAFMIKKVGLKGSAVATSEKMSTKTLNEAYSGAIFQISSSH